MLDSIIDLRTPRITLIIRNAFGGAYAAFNSLLVGADMVLALPTTRVAVMGPAGKEYVYKDELRAMRDAATEGGARPAPTRPTRRAPKASDGRAQRSATSAS